MAPYSIDLRARVGRQVERGPHCGEIRGEPRLGVPVAAAAPGHGVARAARSNEIPASHADAGPGRPVGRPDRDRALRATGMREFCAPLRLPRLYGVMKTALAAEKVIRKTSSKRDRHRVIPRTTIPHHYGRERSIRGSGEVQKACTVRIASVGRLLSRSKTMRRTTVGDWLFVLASLWVPSRCPAVLRHRFGSARGRVSGPSSLAMPRRC